MSMKYYEEQKAQTAPASPAEGGETDPLEESGDGMSGQ